jgi:EpsI family protein
MITKRLFAIELSLVLGLGVVFLLPKAPKASPSGISMALPIWVGSWLGDDVEVSEKERQLLAEDTVFARKSYVSPAGDRVFVSIVLSGEDMTNSIHRPERCLPAQGWSLQRSDGRSIDIKPGKRLNVTRLLSGRPVELKNKQKFIVENVSYYWFIGYHEMTASHIQRTLYDVRDRLLQGYNQRWAYVTVQSTVTAGWMRPERTEGETEKIVEGFMKDLAPLLKRPDGAPVF